MDVTESYRILELEIGASRAAVDAAYIRLVEKWHPDRAAAGDPEAVREAQRMVQSINDAYHTLAKISPNSVNPLSPAAAQTAASESKRPAITTAKAVPPASSESAAPAAAPKNKPKLPPLTHTPSSLGQPPPSTPTPPPPDTWAARPASSSKAPSATPSAPTSAPPPTKSLPPPPPAPSSTPANSKPPVANIPPTTPVVPPVAPTSPPPAEPPAPSAPSRVTKVPGLYDSLFPIGSPLRRYGPAILVAIFAVILLLGKCAVSHPDRKAAQAPDPKTTGRLLAKSNLTAVTIAANRLAAPGDVSTASFSGEIDQPLAGLPPGKYAVIAHAEGWPDVREEVTVEAERTTDVAMNFKGGSLRLDSDPTGAVVRRGSLVLGRTPLVIPLLPPGLNRLTLEYPFWPFANLDATITEGKESSETARLPHGKLTVETSPPGTTVAIGKRVLGKTPLTLEQFPAGNRKVTLEAKDFPAMEVSIAMEDHGTVKIHPALASVFPLIDPALLLRSVWTREDEDRLAPPLEGVTGPFQSRNGIVKNLNRKSLYENWLQKRYRFTAIVKGYDPVTGQIECVEQQSELSKYRILAILAPDVRGDSDLTGQLVKGANLALYGRLSAVEEPRWPSKVITFEFTSAYPVR